jgi:hypothetical protein
MLSCVRFSRLSWSHFVLTSFPPLSLSHTHTHTHTHTHAHTHTHTHTHTHAHTHTHTHHQQVTRRFNSFAALQPSGTPVIISKVKSVHDSDFIFRDPLLNFVKSCFYKTLWKLKLRWNHNIIMLGPEKIGNIMTNLFLLWSCFFRLCYWWRQCRGGGGFWKKWYCW